MTHMTHLNNKNNNNHPMATTISVLAIVIILVSASIVTPAAASPTTTTTTAGNTTTTSSEPSSGIEISSQPIYQKQTPPANVIPINQTHVAATHSGNGTLTLPNRYSDY